ncbi:hypothetical protein SCAW_056930, partial [Saccharomyces cerevisiae]
GKSVLVEPLQLIKGDKCKTPMKIEPVDIPCDEIPKEGSSDREIMTTENKFNFEIKFYQYFDTVADESLVMLNSIGDAYISHDGGQTIKRFDTDGEKIVEIVFNPYFNSSAYLFAVPHEDNELRAYVTNNGAEFAEAKFPYDEDIGKQEAFTILGSEEGSIFLHLATNLESGHDFGNLLKSNSN